MVGNIISALKMKINALHLHNLYIEEPGLAPSLNSREHILSLYLLNGHYSSIHLSAHSIICKFLNHLLSTECVINTMVGIQFSLSVRSDFLWPHGLQHDRLPCPTPTPKACSKSCPLSQWCHQTISSSIVPFSSFLQSLPASRSFPKSQFFAPGGQHIGVSA